VVIDAQPNELYFLIFYSTSYIASKQRSEKYRVNINNK
jgi:hypothetical protein